MRSDLRHNRDVLAGLLFFVIGVLALVFAADYPMGAATRMMMKGKPCSSD